MSRSNKNNRKKIRLSSSGNEQVCCSSSSSSSNSDDMDAIRNAVLESLMKHSTKTSVLSKTARNDAIVKKPIDLENYLSLEALKKRALRSDDEKIRTDVKIVRVKTLNSEESKLLMIVDVMDKNPFRIEVNSDVKREDDEKCIKVNIEALKRGECPKEIKNICTKVRSRRIYKLPDELMKKFDQNGLRVFEWHSFNKPDEVINLLLDDGTKPGEAETVKTEMKMIIGFRKRTERDDDGKNNETKVLNRGARKTREMESRNRNRILQKLLKEYHVPRVLDANQNKINRLVKSHLDLRAKEANEKTMKKDDFGGKTRESKFKIKENLSNLNLRKDNAEADDMLLGDDNVASVSSNGADVSAVDGNNDALNNSNNDDNDSKAKKKNRCALCRKKVGLTGFECRCGGLYCGIHRYSDKHNCTFDYRQLGAQEIRRNNPVVIGEKIQKI